MKIIIASQIRIENPPKKLREQLISLLKIPNPRHEDARKRGFSTWNLEPYIYNFTIPSDGSILIPRGIRPHLSEMLEAFPGLEISTEDRRASFKYEDYGSSSIKYRDYQEKAVDQIMQTEEGLIVAPPGSGKTVVGLSLVPLFGQPCLWITHTNALAKQAVERAKEFLPLLKDKDIGFIGNSKWDLGKVLTVSLVPTLVRRPKELDELKDKFGTVIVDECHHVPASTFLRVISTLNPFRLYGLTATPYRRDRLDELMFQAVGPPIVRISTEEVRRSGGIVMPKVLYRTFRSKPIYGNNIAAILKSLVNNSARNGMIVGDILSEAIKGNYCIVLTDRKAHAEILFDLVSKGWSKTGIATGKYSRKYVEEQSALLNRREITVLICTFPLLGEGFDVPFLNRAFVALPFRAENKVEQLVGRIFRTAPGKTDALVYDYVDSDVGVLTNQFYHKGKSDCRWKAYVRLGLEVEPY